MRASWMCYLADCNFKPLVLHLLLNVWRLNDNRKIKNRKHDRKAEISADSERLHETEIEKKNQLKDCQVEKNKNQKNPCIDLLLSHRYLRSIMSSQRSLKDTVFLDNQHSWGATKQGDLTHILCIRHCHTEHGCMRSYRNARKPTTPKAWTKVKIHSESELKHRQGSHVTVRQRGWHGITILSTSD